jgi:hypothetical protein
VFGQIRAQLLLRRLECVACTGSVVELEVHHRLYFFSITSVVYNFLNALAELARFSLLTLLLYRQIQLFEAQLSRFVLLLHPSNQKAL